ncbi:hypothetical protein NIY04_09295 [Acinetobacter baumannii]|uniref:hypothetical protein n=1 Tax=Acinetobacter baumannii TaxID=470 RepID=UPI00209BE7B8|nr:hypothetical protein [Acinetobacter baumannii]USY42036.1 hypothetical protein NIY04_09295 [Acinetobacter baumannii]
MTAEDPNPTLQHLKRLSIALGMSIDNLAFGEEGSTDEEIAIILNDLKKYKKKIKKNLIYGSNDDCRKQK